VADLHDGLARHLAAAGLVTYDPDGTGDTDVYFDVMPDSPDSAVCLTVYGGAGIDSRLPYDSPSVQVRTRAPADARATARTRAWDLYRELHGLGPADLGDGTRLLSCLANQTPASLGQDATGRLEYVANYSLETFAPSVHRPA
jgi:hypothetical protein